MPFNLHQDRHQSAHARGDEDSVRLGPRRREPAGPLRAAWSRPKQTDLVSGKRQFRSRFHHPLSYGCPTTIFRDPRNRHRHHLSATLLDGRAGNGWARLLRRGRDRSGGRFPNAGYEPHPSCGDCPLTARSRPKRAATISRKIVAGQPYLSGWWKREAELPFTGDQVVCLSHDQAARSGPN